MKDVGGRPTVMTENTLRILEEAFSNGANDLQACFLAKINTESLYAYQRLHPEYSERKAQLKDMIAYQAKQKIKQAIEMEEKPETARWYLERKDKDFKAKQDITTDNKPFPVNITIESNKDVNNATDKTDNQTGGSLGEVAG